MKPEVDLRGLKPSRRASRAWFFGRKDVWRPIIYDLYDENYILYNSFRPFLSSSEVQNLQKIFKASPVQAFTWLLKLGFWSSEDLKILASLSFYFSSSDLHFFLERTKWPSKPKGHVHFSFFRSFFLVIIRLET